MREIKLRLWCNNKQEWEKDYWHLTPDGYVVDVIHNIPMKSDTHILEQFTGHKDKNGKEIYEGDIVSLGHPKLIATIKYEHCSFRLMHVSGSKRRQYCEDGYSELIFRNCNISIEIIGNIHENPELLKETYFKEI